MDVKEGPEEGIKVDIVTGMTNGMLLLLWCLLISIGLEVAVLLIAILSPKYSTSKNCMLELKSAYGTMFNFSYKRLTIIQNATFPYCTWKALGTLPQATSEPLWTRRYTIPTTLILLTGKHWSLTTFKDFLMMLRTAFHLALRLEQVRNCCILMNTFLILVQFPTLAFCS